MIASVSMLSRTSGMTMLDSAVSGSIALAHHRGIGDAAGERRRSRGQRACEVRARARALAALEVAVRRRYAARARRHRIVVDRDAHRTSRFAPFEARVGENTIDSFALGIPAHGGRTGDDHRAHAARDLAPVDD